MSTAGETITYYRGDSSITITAVPGDGQRKGLPDTVTRINGQRDWLIMAAALTFGVPQRGDLIVHGSTTYEVLPQDGEDVYRSIGFIQYRVHAKVISIG